MKKIIMALIMALCLCLTIGSVWAAPYFSTSTGSGYIKFTYLGGGTIQVSIDATKITNTSYGKTDPLVGKYETIYSPAHSSYDFTITRSASGSYIYNASSDALVVKAQASSSGGTGYLQGNTTATRIDFTTGTVTWSTVTNLTLLSNGINSSTLSAFSSYDTGTLQFSFDTTGVLAWLDNPSGYIKKSFSTTLTGGSVSGVPEPGTWLLMIIGLIVMGYLARQHMPAVAAIRIVR